jgi:hypothetical protein
MMENAAGILKGYLIFSGERKWRRGDLLLGCRPRRAFNFKIRCKLDYRWINGRTVGRKIPFRQNLNFAEALPIN